MTRGSDHTAPVLYLNLHSTDGLIVNLRERVHRHHFRALYKNPILYVSTVYEFYHDGGRSPSLFYCLCGISKNAELTPVLAQGDWWHIVPPQS